MIWLIGIAIVGLLCWIASLPNEDYGPDVGFALARLEYLSQHKEPNEPKRLIPRSVVLEPELSLEVIP